MTTMNYQIPQQLNDSSHFSKIRLFVVLFAVGLVGVLTLWLMPFLADVELLMSVTLFKLAALGQGTVLLIILILIGLTTAPKVGLSAPVFQALVTGESKWQALAPQIVPGLIGGLVGALLLFSYALLQPFVTPELVNADSPIEISMLMRRVLYGGIVEELHMRWGLMSLFVWIGWRLSQRGKVCLTTHGSGQALCSLHSSSALGTCQRQLVLACCPLHFALATSFLQMPSPFLQMPSPA